MKKKTIITIIVPSALLIGCLYLCFMWYNRPPKDARSLKTEVHISSNRLADLFNTDEQQANSDYVEKTIEVVGSIEKITSTDDRYTLLLQGQDKVSYVMCDMLPTDSEATEKLRPGQIVRLKGICKGYLMDVIMLNCILIKG